MMKKRSHKRHGMSGLPEYKTWCRMIQRCLNPNNPVYKDYGGRGIQVCDRWRQFENFYADMGPRPSPAHSIDRIDNDGGYAPGNCRWAEPHVQQANKRRPRIKKRVFTTDKYIRTLHDSNANQLQTLTR